MAKSDYFMAVASLGIPVGTTFLIVAGEDTSMKIAGSGLILFGLISWFTAIFSLRQESEERKANFDTLIKEIRGLRQDLGKNKDDE